MRELAKAATAATMTGLFTVMFWVQVGMLGRPCADTPNPNAETVVALIKLP
jgi:predicted Kef-type K+ transport protein